MPSAVADDSELGGLLADVLRITALDDLDASPSQPAAVSANAAAAGAHDTRHEGTSVPLALETSSTSSPFALLDGFDSIGATLDSPDWLPSPAPSSSALPDLEHAAAKKSKAGGGFFGALRSGSNKK
ncbi:hypothetical protein HK405_007704, partial [Cladochytrium tenue]